MEWPCYGSRSAYEKTSRVESRDGCEAFANEGVARSTLEVQLQPPKEYVTLHSFPAI